MTHIFFKYCKFCGLIKQMDNLLIVHRASTVALTNYDESLFVFVKFYDIALFLCTYEVLNMHPNK